MAADPTVLSLVQAYLQYYILGDSSALNSPGVPTPAPAQPGQVVRGTLLEGTPPTSVSVPSNSVVPLRRRQPALQSAPPELTPLPKDPGVSDDPTQAVIDMCGVEDFLLLDGTDLTLVLFWCTDYPSSALSDLLPGLPRTTRVNVPSTIEVGAIALECNEHLQWLLDDDFPDLNLQCQIELVSFEGLSARKAQVAAAPAP